MLLIVFKFDLHQQGSSRRCLNIVLHGSVLLAGICLYLRALFCVENNPNPPLTFIGISLAFQYFPGRSINHLDISLICNNIQCWSRWSMNANERKRERETDRQRKRQIGRENQFRNKTNDAYQFSDQDGRGINSQHHTNPYLDPLQLVTVVDKRALLTILFNSVQIDLVYANKHSLKKEGQTQYHVTESNQFIYMLR